MTEQELTDIKARAYFKGLSDAKSIIVRTCAKKDVTESFIKATLELSQRIFQTARPKGLENDRRRLL